MDSRDLIDFPVSWDWHRHYQQYYEQPDPGPNEPPQSDQPSPDRAPEPGWNRRQWDSVQQMRAQVLHLNGKVTELLAAQRKRKGEY